MQQHAQVDVRVREPCVELHRPPERIGRLVGRLRLQATAEFVPVDGCEALLRRHRAGAPAIQGLYVATGFVDLQSELHLPRLGIPREIIVLHDQFVRFQRDSDRRQRTVRRQLPLQVTEGTEQTPGRDPGLLQLEGRPEKHEIAKVESVPAAAPTLRMQRRRLGESPNPLLREAEDLRRFSC